MSDSQSYLAKLSPWSRSPIVQPNKGKGGEPEPLLEQQKGFDHVVTQRHRLSLRQYPPDCPPLRPHWFHAVDVPKRRPNPAGKPSSKAAKEEKPPPAPKKYAAFSVKDSKAIEAGYRKLSEEQDAAKREQMLSGDIALQKHERKTSSSRQPEPNLSLGDDLTPGQVRVPVNEDYLFDVDIERRELGPAYWLGPVYDVRRGSWFYQDGATQKPCDENLAEQLEDGYLKVKAWRLPPPQMLKPRSSSQPRRPLSASLAPEDGPKPAASVPITPKGSDPDLRRQATESAKATVQTNEAPPGEDEAMQNTYRLFGTHMNSIVTYEDATTAWLLTDDFMSRMNYTMYQRFAGGGHFGGVKLTRGYVSSSKKPEAKDEKATSGKPTAEEGNNKLELEDAGVAAANMTEPQSPAETRRLKLERHMSSLLEEASSEDREKQEEEIRKRDEREMEEDYREQVGEAQDREIEHLILVTHGIGQRLGLRIESVNFVHDINTLRKTIKAVYADSPDLRALNAELGKADTVNSRIQVLPICWRHLLDFPKQGLKRNRGEHDLGDTEHDDENYPALEDISVDGVPAVRNLITDLALDILLYQSPAYKDHISRIVLEECNRIYHLFVERNPDFKGKVSLIGHSLGSAIMFDLLCHQEQQPSHTRRSSKDHNNLKFDFEVDDFYALGSPIGLFQMLKGRTIVARQTLDTRKRAFSSSMDDPMLDSAAVPKSSRLRATSDLPRPDISISSPKCSQIYNIFHPTDPISYRIEPLISPSMSSLKPQPLPYTKRGIFGAPMGQGFSGIGARVSQSVSSMWSNMASNLLTRGLGYSGNEQPQVTSTEQGSTAKSSGPLSLSAGPGKGGATIPHAPIPPEGVEITNMDGVSQSHSNPIPTHEDDAQRPPTLIDSNLETLYTGFQLNQKSAQSDSLNPLGSDIDIEAASERSKRLRREEQKVRLLNSNGRVDYAIQEGAFDINLIAAIASHLSYWSDEDVCHFVVSQVLSRGRRVVRHSSASESLGADPVSQGGG